MEREPEVWEVDYQYDRGPYMVVGEDWGSLQGRVRRRVTDDETPKVSCVVLGVDPVRSPAGG